MSNKPLIRWYIAPKYNRNLVSRQRHEIAKFIVKTEWKNARIPKKYCSMNLTFVSVSWWNNIKLIVLRRLASLAYLPHDKLVYPPKIYLPTFIIVTVGPLPSHREWKVLGAQPSTDARQQRFQTELTLFVTGLIQLLNEVKWFLLFFTMTEFSKPKGEKTIFHYMRYKVLEILLKLNLFSLRY